MAAHPVDIALEDEGVGDAVAAVAADRIGIDVEQGQPWIIGQRQLGQLGAIFEPGVVEPGDSANQGPVEGVAALVEEDRLLEGRAPIFGEEGAAQIAAGACDSPRSPADLVGDLELQPVGEPGEIGHLLAPQRGKVGLGLLRGAIEDALAGRAAAELTPARQRGRDIFGADLDDDRPFLGPAARGGGAVPQPAVEAVGEHVVEGDEGDLGAVPVLLDEAAIALDGVAEMDAAMVVRLAPAAEQAVGAKQPLPGVAGQAGRGHQPGLEAAQQGLHVGGAAAAGDPAVGLEERCLEIAAGFEIGAGPAPGGVSRGEPSQPAGAREALGLLREAGVDQQIDKPEPGRGRRSGRQGLGEEGRGARKGGSEALRHVRVAQPEIIPPGLKGGGGVALEKRQMQGHGAGEGGGSRILAGASDQLPGGGEGVRLPGGAEVQGGGRAAKPYFVPLRRILAGGGEDRNPRQEGRAEPGFVADPGLELAGRAAVVSCVESLPDVHQGPLRIPVDQPGDAAELPVSLRPVAGGRVRIGGDLAEDGFGLADPVVAVGLHRAVDRLGRAIGAARHKQRRQAQSRSHSRPPVRVEASG